jgi:hypothetical protein
MPARILRFVPGFESTGVDARLIVFTAGLALLTAAIFGVLPALQAAHGVVADALKEGGRTATGRQLLRRAIVVAEMSIALPLLVAAGLGVAGAQKFLNGPQGYNPDRLLVMKLVLPDRTYPDDGSRRQFVRRALDEIMQVPGVEHAAVVNHLPAGGSNSSRTIEIDGHPALDSNNPAIVDHRAATRDYFVTMGIPLVRGRAFTTLDSENGAPVAIVSESMAKKYWPGEDPIGRRIRYVWSDAWITIVGVVGTVRDTALAAPPSRAVYFPQVPVGTDFSKVERTMALVVRTAGPPAAVVPAVRRAVRGRPARGPGLRERSPGPRAVRAAQPRDFLISAALRSTSSSPPHMKNACSGTSS